MIAAVADAPPAMVARFVKNKVNQGLQFRGKGGKILSVKCIPEGASHYQCKGQFAYGGSTVGVYWGDVLFNLNTGMWKLPGAKPL